MQSGKGAVASSVAGVAPAGVGTSGVTGGSAKVEVVLVALRARAFDVHARLAELADLIAQVRDGVGEGRTTTWTEFLGKFDALCALAGQLCEELERAVGEAGLSHYVIHPSSRAAVVGDGEVPNLLRTRREPDLERDVETLAASFTGDTAPDALAKRITTFNAFVDGLVDEIADLREEHAPQAMVEPSKARPPAAASALLNALTTGAGL